MVKVFVVLGVALLAGGGYAVVDGWPYLVLERGFTQVIIGALAATAGLILLALAAVLAELRRLKGMVTGAVAMMTIAGSDRRDEPVPAGVPGDDDAPRAAEKTGSGLATGLAAGAGAAAIGGAVAGLARTSDRSDSAGEDAVMARPEPDDTPATTPAVTDEATPTPAPASDHDDWLSPPDPAPAHAVAQAEADHAKPEAAPAAELDFFEAELLPTPEEPVAPPADEAKTADTGPAEAEPASADADEAQQDLALEPEPAAAAADEDRVWWPRLDRFDEGKAAAGDVPASSDDFGALREHLAGPSGSAKSAPEIEPPRRDFDIAGSWTAPRPWPPVTQPRPPEALGELEAPAPAEEAETEADREKSEADWQTPPVAPEPSPAPAAEAEPAPAEGEPAAAEPEAETEPPAPEERPASSEEGVIGAYQVGETHFTMYADGSIHARTPDGDYVFASMDELKTYLASEKNRLEPSSN